MPTKQMRPSNQKKKESKTISVMVHDVEKEPVKTITVEIWDVKQDTRPFKITVCDENQEPVKKVKKSQE